MRSKRPILLMEDDQMDAMIVKRLQQFLKTIIPFIMIFLNLLVCLYAHEHNIRFRRISIEDGLSQSDVNCIVQDRRGFMWFGTEDGLNKYDGYSFKVYRSDPENPKSLSNNNVEAIYEDRSGVLWIGTEGGGLNKFNPKDERFAYYQTDPNDPHSLSNNRVLSIYEDRSGVLWIGTEGGGLNKFVPGTEEGSPPTFIHYQTDPNDPHSLSGNRVLSIYEDLSGVLWIGTALGLNKLVPSVNEGSPPSFIHYQTDPNDPHSLSNNRVMSIYEDRSGVLWIGTEGGGLNKFVPGTEEGSPPTFIRYQTDPNESHSLSNNNVMLIYEDRSGVLWIGTYGGGLNKLVPGADEGSPPTFIYYQTEPNDPHSLSNNRVMSIYEDRSGVLWIGTDLGLNTFDQEEKQFILYQSNLNDPHSLSNNFVRPIYEDRSGVLWIGTYGGGLNKYDRKKGQFTHYRQNPKNPNSLSNDLVRSIYEDRSGVLWIGTEDGLNKLVPSVNEGSPPTFIHYKKIPDDPHSLSNNFIYSIYEDRSGVLWIGTAGGGLNKLVLSADEGSPPTFTQYKSNPNDPHSLINNFVYTIYEDRFDVLWIGTFNGLNKLDREKGQFTHYQANPNDPYSLRNDYILSIHEDQSGVLWIGTAGGGLNKLVPSPNEGSPPIFIHYTEKEGLPNDVIYGILEDDQGNLWLSHNKGLSKFNPRTETFKNYDVSDGLQSNEFNGGSYHRSQSGEMFFGGIKGLNSFYPDKIRENPYIPPVVITNFQIFNKSVPIGEGADGRSILKKPITETEEIKLSHKDRVFSFEFAALHYASPGKNEYAYMMDGFEQDWNEVGNRRFATYTNLPPGKYIFRVKGSNNDVVWNEEGVSLKITVTPPTWQTWWFRGSGVIAIFLLMFSFYQVRTHNIRERNRQLENRVEERTRGLKAATVELEAANKELRDFVYIISHDLKAPLRAISQLTTWISEDYTDAFDKGGREQMSLLIGRVERMYNLLDGILQYSRVRLIKGREEEIDLDSITREVIEDIAPPDNIQVTIENQLPVVLADRVQIEQVFQNLIGNAVKFMDKPEGEIKIGGVDEGTHWRFSVADNGPGIDEIYHDKIFQIFQTLEPRDERESTGVGLSVVKKIVELYGGKVWVESKVGEGSTFFFTLKKRGGENEK